MVEQVAARPVPLEIGPPRPGDPPILFSDPAKIKAELGWAPHYPNLRSAVRHAWDWRIANYPNGSTSPIDPLAYAGPAYTAKTDAAPPVRDDPRILIVGAGPTGLCAAYRLKELGYTNWQLLEKSLAAGGLATSVTDAKGFTWDIGVHVLFSHFGFFDALLDEYLQASLQLALSTQLLAVCSASRVSPHCPLDAVSSLPSSPLLSAQGMALSPAMVACMDARPLGGLPNPGQRVAAPRGRGGDHRG